MLQSIGVIQCWFAHLFGGLFYFSERRFGDTKRRPYLIIPACKRLGNFRLVLKPFSRAISDHLISVIGIPFDTHHHVV
ncbi:hypothetical protein [Vibrio aphrogenes]|uniref:hypothetical protein n=1 Tax=Vibrio aphrogenes TaxID=1891186 RepID=UPI000F7D9D6D|nr:hypothetical protein [Vibrio aphrogenes]